MVPNLERIINMHKLMSHKCTYKIVSQTRAYMQAKNALEGCDCVTKYCTS